MWHEKRKGHGKDKVLKEKGKETHQCRVILFIIQPHFLLSGPSIKCPLMKMKNYRYYRHVYVTYSSYLLPMSFLHFLDPKLWLENETANHLIHACSPEHVSHGKAFTPNPYFILLQFSTLFVGSSNPGNLGWTRVLMIAFLTFWPLKSPQKTFQSIDSLADLALFQLSKS